VLYTLKNKGFKCGVIAALPKKKKKLFSEQYGDSIGTFAKIKIYRLSHAQEKLLRAHLK